MGHIYTRIAGVLMDKGEYETALSFYAKAYGIFDGTLGLHDDTKKALMNVKLAAEKNRNANLVETHCRVQFNVFVKKGIYIPVSYLEMVSNNAKS